MRLPNDEVLKQSSRYLELIGGKAMTTPEKEAFIAETVDSYEKFVNRGFLTYRKSVTEAGQFAALEWSGEGAMLRDLLGREYIDCLGGYGIFSAGINHPKIVKAVRDVLDYADKDALLIMENNAGQGGGVGVTFAELGAIIRGPCVPAAFANVAFITAGPGKRLESTCA